MKMEKRGMSVKSASRSKTNSVGHLDVVEIYGDHESGEAWVSWGYAVYDYKTASLRPTIYRTAKEATDEICRDWESRDS